MRPFFDATPLLADPDALRARMDCDGYLFLRRLLPAEPLAALHRAMMEIASDSGWLLPGASLEERAANPAAACVDPEPAFLEVYRRMYMLEALHALPHHPTVVRFFERFLGERPLLHPRLLVRAIFPRRERYTTPAHQDHFYVQGTPETFTTWVPLSACPRTLGSLQVAAGSHKRGLLDVRPTWGVGAAEVDADLNGSWTGGDFELGDVLLFHSLTVHRAHPNTTDRLRLSMDFRYQSVRAPISAVCLDIRGNHMTWDSIYASWGADAPRYYWKEHQLHLVGFDMGPMRRRDDRALALAERGEACAISCLQRMVAFERDPLRRARAVELLARMARAQDGSHPEAIMTERRAQ